MKQQDNQIHDDEIDLADLVRSLWRGKWLVVGIAIATLMSAIAYLMLVPKTYTGSFEISTLPTAQADVYSEFNTYKFMAADKQRFLSLFTDDIKPLSEIRKLIKSSSYLEKKADETDQEFESRVAIVANYDFSLVPPTPNVAKNPQPNWVMNITTQAPALATQIITDALVISNDNVNKYLVSNFDQLAQAYARNNRLAIEDLDLSKHRAHAIYDLKTEAKVNFLREQAKIARVINLRNGELLSQSYVNGSTVVNASSQEEPVYLRGYLAIEQEIELIESRQSPSSFVSQTPAIEEARLKLLQDTTLTRAKQLFANTPIGTERFTAAIYDINALGYKSKTKTLLVLILAGLLGGMLGVLVLLMRNILIKED